MADNKEIAKNVLGAVGGKENVQNVTHCMTRLRFVLDDENIPKDEEVKKIQGVLGVARSAGQYQVIIGINVPKVYEEICRLGGFAMSEMVDATKDSEKEVKGKLTVKAAAKNALDYMAGSMTPIIPVMLAGGLFSAMNAILGPGLLKLYAEESNIYILFQMLYNAAYYFLPILVGMNAAKKLNVNQMLGGYLGCILIAPELISMVNEGAGFTVFGIPCQLNNYSQTVIPVILSVFAMSLVYKLVKKILPDILSTVFTPFLTMVISTPIALCLLAPMGSVIGNAISGGLIAFGNATGFFGIGFIAAIWEFLVMTGMHLALIVPMMAAFFETGTMAGPMLGGSFATWACYGVAFGAALRLKNKEAKTNAFGFFASGVLGGITEPTLYGICLQHVRCFGALMLGGFVGGAYAGIVDLHGYVMSTANFLSFLTYTGGTTANLINGIIATLLSFGVAAAATYFIGFTKKELEA